MSKINLVYTRHTFDKNGKGDFYQKHYKNGQKVELNWFPYYWGIRETIEWNSFSDLAKALRPTLKGETEEHLRNGIMRADFKPEAYEKENEGKYRGEGYTKRLENLIDVPKDYVILDIETDDEDYEDISGDLTLIKEWLIEKYDFLKDDTGMLLTWSPSSCLITENNHYKQIRCRVIFKTTKSYTNKQLHSIFQPYFKQPYPDFVNAIDGSAFSSHIAFYVAPPILEDTSITRGIEERGVFLFNEGGEVDLTELVSSSNTPTRLHSSPDGIVISNLTIHQLVEKTQEELWEEIGDGNRNRGIYYYLYKAVLDGNEQHAVRRLLYDKEKSKGRNERDIKGKLEWIKTKGALTDLFDEKITCEGHTEIKVDVPYFKSLENVKEFVHWKSEGVVIMKLREATGKNLALEILREKYPDKSFCFISPNETPTYDNAETLGLENYKTCAGEWYEHDKVAVCYNSIVKMKSDYRKGGMYQILVLDEAEQTLHSSVSNQLMNQPSLQNDVLRTLIEQAELVVCLDARATDRLTKTTLEEYRKHKGFDIYTHSAMPLSNSNFNLYEDYLSCVKKAVELAKEGKRVAVVTELDDKVKTNNSRITKPLLSALINTIVKGAGLKEEQGRVLWAGNKSDPLNQAILRDLSKPYSEDKHIGALEAQLLKDLRIVGFSPVNVSAWSYLDVDCPFDAVIGLYPNNVLTAPSILQHIRRFRRTKDFHLYIREKNRRTDYLLWLYRKQWNVGKKAWVDTPTRKSAPILSMDETFEKRHEWVDVTTKASRNQCLSHFCALVRNQGGNPKYVDNPEELPLYVRQLKQKQNKRIEKILKLEDKEERERFFNWHRDKEVWKEAKNIKSLEDWEKMELLTSADPKDRAIVELNRIRKLYRPVNKSTLEPKDITDELLEHYYSPTRTQSVFNRLITTWTDEVRKEFDGAIQFRADTQHFEDKGLILDDFISSSNINLSETGELEVPRNDFITNEAIKETEWYRKLCRVDFRKNVERIFGLEVPLSFKDNPLPFFRKFGVEMLGLSITKVDEVWKEPRTKAKEALFEEHKKGSYREVFGATPKGNGNKLKASEQILQQKVFVSMTAVEKRYKKASTTHLEIRPSTFHYEHYLSMLSDKIILIEDFYILSDNLNKIAGERDVS